LERYLLLLSRYRKKVNLTGTRDEEELRSLIEDSLIPFPDEGRILDLGTGGGLPGLPLLLVHPLQQLDIPFPLLLTGEASRFSPDYACFFDSVVSRGMGETEFVLEQAAPFLKEGGRAWLWKPAGFMPENVTGKGYSFLAEERLDCSLCSVAVYRKRGGEG
jgi:16S rRNA G527 N7-methylase RsmG